MSLKIRSFWGGNVNPITSPACSNSGLINNPWLGQLHPLLFIPRFDNPGPALPESPSSGFPNACLPFQRAKKRGTGGSNWILSLQSEYFGRVGTSLEVGAGNPQEAAFSGLPLDVNYACKWDTGLLEKARAFGCFLRRLSIEAGSFNMV